MSTKTETPKNTMSDKSTVTIQSGGKAVMTSASELGMLAKRHSDQHSKIDAIGAFAAEQLAYLIHESAEEIRLAMLKCVEESALQGKEAKFPIGFTITLNLDGNKQVHKLAWSQRVTRETEGEIPEPNQERLKL